MQQTMHYGNVPFEKTRIPLGSTHCEATRANIDVQFSLVPVVAKGFEDLKKRADAQVANAAAQAQALAVGFMLIIIHLLNGFQELNARLDAISQKHSLSTSIRAQKAARSEQEIKQRLTSLIRHLHLLIPTVRSSSIRPEEEALRVALENVEGDLQLGKTRGKLSELANAIAALKAMRERARQSGGDGGGVEWTVVDEDGLGQLVQVRSKPANRSTYPLSVQY
jgi:nuclear pore complex protein Nup54